METSDQVLLTAFLYLPRYSVDWFGSEYQRMV